MTEFRISRESRIRVDRDGRFWHEEQLVTHDRLAKALASWLAIDPETGRYILKNALDWCYVTVEDAPLGVRTLTWADPPTLLLSDGTTETLDATTLRLDAEDVPYCDVRAGGLHARFSRSAAYVLLSHVKSQDDALVLDLPSGPVALRRVAATR